MEQNSGGHSLHAIRKVGDLIPTLYVGGGINANGDLVGVHLEEVPWSEQKPDTLGLKFVPDEYDPNGKTHVQVKTFEKKLEKDDQYKKVVIETKRGNIHLNVVLIKRDEQPPFAIDGGGGEAPRGQHA